MKILIDMNLSPEWVSVLRQAGHDPVHWSEKGALITLDESRSRVRLLPV